jgi:hypothetical protein
MHLLDPERFFVGALITFSLDMGPESTERGVESFVRVAHAGSDFTGGQGDKEG